MSTDQPKITKFFVSTSPVKSCICDDGHITIVPGSKAASEGRSKLSLKRKRGPLNGNEPEKRLGQEAKRKQDSDGIRSDSATLSLPKGENGVAERITLSESLGTTEVIGNVEPVEPRVPYYLENLVLVINCVKNRDDWNLFSEPEKKMFSDLLEADERCQKLFARLLQRKHIWRRASKICYPDIADDLSPVLLALQRKGYLEDVTFLKDLGTCLSLLSPEEMKKLAQVFRLKTVGRGKGSLADALLDHCSKQQSVFSDAQQGSLQHLTLAKALALLGPAWRLRDEPRDAWRRLLRLFSLGTPWDTEEAGETPQVYGLELVSAGKMVFPDYTVWRRDVLFETRQNFIRYEESRQLEHQLMQATLNRKWTRAKEILVSVEELSRSPQLAKCHERDSRLAPFLRRYTICGVYTRCRSLGVEVLQRLKEYPHAIRLLHSLLAQALYCQSRRGHWWDRLALNLDAHMGKQSEALQAVKDGLDDPQISPASRHSLLTRMTRLLAKMPKHPLATSLLAVLHPEDSTSLPEVEIKGQLADRMVLGRTNLFAVRDGQDTHVIPVEQVALRHYREQGYPQGVHGEGATFHALFGLLCWNVIYMEGVPDAFRTPYQAFPLDLHSESFFASRQERFQETFHVLQNSSNKELESRLATTYKCQEGKAGLVQWDRFSLTQIQELAGCLGGPVLAEVCQLMARNFRHKRSGQPDLLVWNPSDGRLKAVEVKGPGDTLSAKQVVWLRHLLALGVDCEVCRVVATSSKRLCT